MFYPRNYPVSGRNFIIVLSDIVAIVLSLFLAAIIRLGFEEGLEYYTSHIGFVLGSCAIFVATFYAVGMYEQQVISHRNYMTGLSLITVGLGMALIILVFYARSELNIGRGIMLIGGVIIFCTTWSIRTFYRIGLGQGFFSRPLLIVGEGKEAKRIIDLIQDQHFSYFKIFGIVAPAGSRKQGFIRGIPVLGSIDQLKEFVNAYSVETIVIATSLSKEYELLGKLRHLRYSGVELLDFVSLNEEIAQWIPLDHIDDEWLMHAAMNSSRVHILKLKRILDVLVASVGLLLSAPLSLFCLIIIPLESKGPVFYKQKRCGVGGKVFTVMKFRTMQEDAESGTGAIWADKADARVTRVGGFLRATRIDEIPQLINVLIGNMSLVGPRPERPEFVKTLGENIPFYQERLLVLPGITGWAQVKFPYAASIDAARKKLQYDLYYIKHMSLLLDVAILLKTFKTIVVGLKHSGAESRANVEEEEGEVRVISTIRDDEGDSSEETA